jgi:hypothetical protein
MTLYQPSIISELLYYAQRLLNKILHQTFLHGTIVSHETKKLVSPG